MDAVLDYPPTLGLHAAMCCGSLSVLRVLHTVAVVTRACFIKFGAAEAAADLSLACMPKVSLHPEQHIICHCRALETIAGLDNRPSHCTPKVSLVPERLTKYDIAGRRRPMPCWTARPLRAWRRPCAMRAGLACGALCP